MGAPLSHDDVARLHLESRDNPMTITAVLALGAAITPAAIDDLLRERLVTRPRFRDRVVEHTLAGPRWEPDDRFDLRAHVHHVGLAEPTFEALRELVEDLASTPLDLRVPLWQAHLVTDVGGASALIVRVHHVIADGLALVDVLLGLTDEGARGWTPPTPPRIPGGSLGAALAPAFGLASLALSPPEPRTALTTHPTPHKRLAWTRDIPLAPLHDRAREWETGVTPLLLAVTAGALRAALRDRQDVPRDLVLRAMVPLSTRSGDERSTLGNRFASVFVGLPVGLETPRERVAETDRRLRRVRVAGGVSLGRKLIQMAGSLGASIEHLGVEHLSRRASLVVSNVPGPSERRHLGGVPLRSVVAFAPTSGEVALGVTWFGYGGSLTAGVSAGLRDESVARDLARHLDAECDALLSGGGAATRKE